MQPWRVNETNKLARFAPEIFLAAPVDVLQSARGPIGNGCEDRARRRRALRFPKVGHDRLPGWKPLQSMEWHRKLFRSDVFAKGKKGMMSFEIIDG